MDGIMACHDCADDSIMARIICAKWFKISRGLLNQPPPQSVKQRILDRIGCLHVFNL